MKLSKETIRQIEEALQHHLNYNNVNRVNGKYLRMIDSLSSNYAGTQAEKNSALMSDYFADVQVKNLSEAIIRLQNNKDLK